MKNEKLLLLIADKLESLGGKPYCMTDFAQDAMFYAAQVPELRKLGLAFHANDNDGPRLWFKKKHKDLDAVIKLFDISEVHAQFLFGMYEIDPWGYSQRSPFATGYRRNGEVSDTGSERWNEPPGWTAARIRMFVREYPKFPSLIPKKANV